MRRWTDACRRLAAEGADIARSPAGRWILALALCALLLLLRSDARAQTPREFEVVLSAGQLGAAGPVGRTMGQALGVLTAFADGQPCVSADVAVATADVVLRLGGPGQPAACSRERARVTFRDSEGRELFMEMTLRRGVREVLANFAPKPAVTGGVVPPASGDAGLRASGQGP